MPPSKVDSQQPSLLEKIELATSESAKVVSIFAPAVGELIQAGVAIEPLIIGFGKMVASFFHHHTGVTPATGK